jgi:hypothetical protein
MIKIRMEQETAELAKKLPEPKKLSHADIDEMALEIKDGKLRPKDLKKLGLSKEDIGDIIDRSRQLRPRNRGTNRIIDLIDKSKDRVKQALERVRQNPNDIEAMNELQAAQQQLQEIQAAQRDIPRIEGK